MLKKALKLFSQDSGIVGVIFLLSLGLRLFLLDKFPIGITHDELNYVFAAKSIFYTFRFVPQTAPALLPGGVGSTVVIAEIPAFILSVFVGFLKFNLFNARVVGVLFSSFSGVVLYKLVQTLIKKKVYSVASGIIWAINPWSFLMGRTVFEVNFFDFFFLLGFYILLKNKGYKVLYSLPFYILGFLSYTGGQIAFYLFIISTLVFHYFYIRAKNVRPYIGYVVAVTLLLIIYLFVIFHNQSLATRGGELYLPTASEITKQVDAERLISVPSPLDGLFTNKATLYIKGFMEKYLSAFSVNTLFLNGEFRAAFSYQKHGTFYLVDAIFMIVGIGALFKLDRRFWIFAVGAIAIAPITSGFSTIEYSYSQRAGLMFPFLIVFVGIGIGYFCEVMKGKWKLMTMFLVFVIYLISFANLAHLYFYRFPVYASDDWFFQDRTLSRYIELTTQKSSGRKIIVTTFEPKIIFEEYLFYNNLYGNMMEIVTINDKISKSDYSLLGVSFTSRCPDKKELSGVTWIYDPLSKCNLVSDGSKLRITRFRDIYEEYLIYNDVLCSDFSLGRYVSPEAFMNFDVENLSAKNFCESFITKI